MTKHILFPIIVTVGILALLGFLLKKGNKIPQNPFKTPVKFETSSIKVGENTIYVYLADTEEKKRAGLSNWPSMEPNYGMLFYVSNFEPRPSFWMKDMKFPIDIVWINKNKVVQIMNNVEIPIEGIPDEKLPLLTPKTNVDYVLELNSDGVENFEIKVGSTVDFSELTNSTKSDSI